MKSLLLAIFGAAFANNCALEQFLGIEQALGFSKRESRIKLLGLSVTGVLLLLAIVKLLLAPLIESLGLAYLEVMIYAAVILALVYILGWALKRLGKTVDFYFPVVALNSGILALALDSTEGYGIAAAIGTGIGFTVALLLLHGVQSKIQEKYVPTAFRGLPISLLTAAIISMALVGFK